MPRAMARETNARRLMAPRCNCSTNRSKRVSIPESSMVLAGGVASGHARRRPVARGGVMVGQTRTPHALPGPNLGPQFGRGGRIYERRPVRQDGKTAS